jgi:hypothetical protein
MDVVVWLRSLGLGKYEAAFRENEIDARERIGKTTYWATATLASRCDSAMANGMT